MPPKTSSETNLIHVHRLFHSSGEGEHLIQVNWAVTQTTFFPALANEQYLYQSNQYVKFRNEYHSRSDLDIQYSLKDWVIAVRILVTMEHNGTGFEGVN